MELYIGNIPDDTEDYDLRKFFSITGGQLSFKIVNHDGADKAHRYGLVSVESDKLARKIMKQFHGRPFRDKRLIVREFNYRNYSNDRRALDWRQRGWAKMERRGRNRRGMQTQMGSTAKQGAAVFNLG
ncbi:RNA recognition motif domain-containing protein [Sulfuriflexus mobilis]|uniref:RNA recognition motif domain-containing protein n=1 Tax=Sulfuriflexus mobilis TaxID=1811807 RepID=UPI000F84499C|nr:RNA-binding protein [Sulfuriflexus mobilis]